MANAPALHRSRSSRRKGVSLKAMGRMRGRARSPSGPLEGAQHCTIWLPSVGAGPLGERALPANRTHPTLP
jgi:hypothetical protein